MKDWLVKLAEQTKSEDEVLQDALSALPPSMLQELAYEFDPSSRPTHMDDMQAKIASATQMGRELAHEHGDGLEKHAFLGALAGGVAKMVGSAGVKSLAGGVVKNMAQDAVVGGAKKAIGGMVRPTNVAAPTTGFNYGGKLAAASGLSFGRQAAGFFHKNPGAAVTLAGAAGGALMAPRDPQTGEKQYLRGAVMGGGLAAGANALSSGRIGNTAKTMVTRQNNPILGQGARRYMTESALATREGGGGAAKALASRAPAPAAKPAPGASGAAAMQAAPRAGAEMSHTPPPESGPTSRSSQVAQVGAWRQQSAKPFAEPNPLAGVSHAMAPSSAPKGGPMPHDGLAQYQDKLPTGSPDHNPTANVLADRGKTKMNPVAAGAAGAQPPAYGAGPVGGQIKVASRADLILRAASMDKLANSRPGLAFDPASKTFVRPNTALMGKVAALRKRAAMFSTKLSPARAGSAVMGGGMKGLQSASRAVTPPPTPMRGAGGGGTFAAPAGPSPFAAPPRM